MNGSLKQAFNTKRYLLLTAVWLFVISFLFSTFFSYQTSVKRATSQVESHLQKSQRSYHELIGDTTLIYELYREQYRKTNPTEVFDKNYGFFLYSINDLGNPIINFWSTHTSEPLLSDVIGKEGSKLVEYKNGFFVLEKHSVKVRNIPVIAVALYPVKWKYFLENRYLQSEFEGLKGIGQLYDVTKVSSDHVVKDIHKKPVFSLVKLENRSLPEFDTFSIILWILGTLCLFLYVNAVVNVVTKSSGLRYGIGALLGFILLYRFLTLYIPFPFNYRKLELFDASVYASSNLFPSLGDLLLNSLLVFWIIIFSKNHFIK